MSRHAVIVEKILDEEHTVILTVPTREIPLTPAQAEQLAEDLMAAAATPVPCATGCGRLAEADYCGQCQDGGAGEVRRGWGA
ncbi:MAG TPA: hypothetical protein VFJ94_03905 [Intrasporangium sp.]|uniref:hypothetical protein n=1 Tax=Intrasporangium sp. TaxID=1925024 RepID=UPI002D7A3131|nr:hypothetical protein [Intrasporangium sp.]HET7397647.1 hypothetical protein [Intrasporangium sp.]